MTSNCRIPTTFANPEIVSIGSVCSGDLHLNRQLRATEARQTLLTFLARHFSYHSEDQWVEQINLGAVTVNGVAGQSEQVLSTGDLLAYHASNFSEPEVPSYFEPILQTDHLLLVGKPAGTPITRTGLIVRNTFINLLRGQYGDDLHPLHRLDRETSGILLCARSGDACRKYQSREYSLLTGKYYLALVHGKLPKDTMSSEQSLATRTESPVRCQMWPDGTGKPCRTIFHPLAVSKTFSLVLAELLTGRRHQIRAHLAHLGFPVVGDKIYGHEGYYYLKRITGELTAADYRELGADNHTLHAWALRLNLPDRPEQIFFSQLFSEDFRRYLALFPNWERSARDCLAKITTTSLP